MLSAMKAVVLLTAPLLTALLLTASCAKAPDAGSTEATMKKLTPILTVESIEPCLAFWRDSLGFRVAQQVPEGDGPLAFVILQHGVLEVMLQTRASVEQDDVRLAAAFHNATSCLYLDVEDLALVEAAVDPAAVVIPRRKTFYGAEEVFVRTPGGHIVGFAQFAGPAE